MDKDNVKATLEEEINEIVSEIDGKTDETIILLKKELEKVQEELLRSMAELENARKRSARENAETHKYAITRFAKDVLSVSDNLERALSSFPAETSDKLMQTIRTGVELAQQEFARLLERHQIHKVPAKGLLFDPHLHQAMSEVEAPDCQTGTIVDVLQEGYMLSDRLLRPALVNVSKA